MFTPGNPMAVPGLLLATICLGCSSPPKAVPTQPASPEAVATTRAPGDPVSIPTETLEHFSVISVRVGDSIESRMILDTGIGVTLVSRALCERAQCLASGQYTGHRMSGQPITVPLGRIASLTVAARRNENVQVGIIDRAKLLPPGIDGILSVGFFEAIPFTIDYRAGALIIENAASLEQRKAVGAIVPLEIEKDGATVTLFMSMEIPHGPPARVEIDTGSDSLILDERYMGRLGVDPASPSVKVVKGQDETSQEYVRTFADIAGSIYPRGAPQMKQENPRVMFQKIVYDGLVGHAFFKSFHVTYNLPQSQIILAAP
jgi:hypothetical protein